MRGNRSDKRGHRNTKYSAYVRDSIADMYRTGEYLMEDIAQANGIDVSTFYYWKDKYPDFAEAIKTADKERLQRLRETAVKGLNMLANGFEFTEETTEFKRDKNGNPQQVASKKTKKFIAPNPTALIFALKNVDKENFADVVKNELTGADGGAINVSGGIVHTVNFKRSDGTNDNT